MPLIEHSGLTLVGIGVENLEDDADQLALPLGEDAGSLDATLDGVRDRFGSAAITRATLLGADERLARRGSSRATGASTPVDRAILRSDRR